MYLHFLLWIWWQGLFIMFIMLMFKLFITLMVKNKLAKWFKMQKLVYCPFV